MKELGADTIDVMRSIKRALDPYGLMNPGKIFELMREEEPQGSAKATAATSLQTPNKTRLETSNEIQMKADA